MSTRSATNKRTTEHEVTGVARRSAASAKPARAAAGSVRVVPSSSKARRQQQARGEDLSNLSKEERKARKREIRNEEDRVYAASNYLMKSDEDYKRRRIVWWVLLGLGVGFIFVLWIMLYVAGQQNQINSMAQLVLIVLSYVAIISAFVYDFIRIRPIRNMYRDQAEGMTQKQLISLMERAAAEEDHKRAEKEAKKAAKKNK